FGVPVSHELRRLADKEDGLSFVAFGLADKQLEVTRISPRPADGGSVVDIIGIVTTLEGQPLPAGDIASRLGVYADVEKLEAETIPDEPVNARLIEAILGSQNDQHNGYQDFQRFLDLGGRIGL